jgi:flagellar biosynthesis/type III secretory pathway protein FliH
VHTTAAKRPTNSGINPNWMRTKEGKTEKKKERKKEGKTEGKTEGKKEGKKESHLC